MSEEKKKVEEITSSKNNPKKLFVLLFFSTDLIIIFCLIILSICCLRQGFFKNPLLLPGALFIFILFDFSIFLFNSHIGHAEKQKKSDPQNSEPLKYYPDFKIWGMGFILGLTVFIFSYFEPLKDALLGKKDILVDKSEIVMVKDIKILDCRVSSMELIQQAAVMAFFLVVIGLILAALVKIVKDE